MQKNQCNAFYFLETFIKLIEKNLMTTPRQNLITEFETWMIPAALDHINEGWSMASFAGKYCIPAPKWKKMIDENETLMQINELYKMRIGQSKQRYWMRRKS